jgi:hypothetical protein
MPKGLVTMSSREIDRGELIRRVRAKELKQGKAAELMGISVRLPYCTVDKAPHVSPGDIVENKRLGAVLATIQAAQAKRDEGRLASPKMTIAQKERLRARRPSVQVAAQVTETRTRRRGRPPKVSRPDRVTVAGVDPNGPLQAFFDEFAAEQAERRRKYNDAGNDRKRAREFEAVKRRQPSSS